MYPFRTLGLTLGLLACQIAAADGMPSAVHPVQEPASASRPMSTQASDRDSADFPLLVLEKALAVPDRSARGQPHQVGFSRKLPRGIWTDFWRSYPMWEAGTDGSYAMRFAIQSPGARGIRLAMLVRRLPDQAALRISGLEDDGLDAIVVNGRHILKVLGDDRAAAPDGEHGTLYWSPMVEGEQLFFELLLPAGLIPDDVDVEFLQLSHIYAANPFGEYAGNALAAGDAASCHRDLMCESDADIQFGTATARITYIRDGASYACSGTLLNDADPAADFHFLTANHCVDSQVVASTVEFHWRFRADACNSPWPGDDYVRQPGGATLLNTLGSTFDSTLLRLNQPPPGGVTMSGWTTLRPNSGEAVIAIHHPRGDLQKLSAGLAGYSVACEAGGDYYYCGIDPGGRFFSVDWTDGIVEPGSSGSGLFLDEQLIGNLSSSNVSCSSPNEPAFYASFGDAYRNGNYADWLQGAPLASNGDAARSLSTRGQVEPGLPMHGGIVVEGDVKVLITARGPTTGLAGALADTRIRLFDLNTTKPRPKIDENDNWPDAAHASRIALLTGGRPLAASEAAMLVTLSSGTYSVIADAPDGRGSGELVLGFTLVQEPGFNGVARSLSTRGLLTPTEPMHGGLTLNKPARVLIAARGPSTSIPDALADAVLKLYRLTPGQAPQKLYESDDWVMNLNAAEIAALTRDWPLSSYEPALLVDLPAGLYSAMAHDYQNDEAGEVLLVFRLLD